jgi:hypothetical protein
MISMPTLSVGIMSSYRLEKATIECQNSWLKYFETYFIFVGFKKMKGAISLGRIGEDWTSAFLKQQLGLKYMFNNDKSYNWYSILGTDNILYKERIEQALSSFNHDQKYFIGTRLKELTIDGINFDCLAGGGGFFISNGLMREIFEFLDDFNVIWYNLYKSRRINYPYGASDIALSFMLKKYFDCNLQRIDGLYTSHPRDYDFEIKKPITLHYIKPYEMSDVFKKYL